MTDLEFQFWQAAFLAAMQGCLAYSYCDPERGNWQVNSSEPGLAKQCGVYADAALAMWREKRRELHMPERDAETIATCRPGHRLVDVDGTWTEVKNAE